MDVTALELHAAQAGIRRKVDAGAVGQAKIDIHEANALVRHVNVDLRLAHQRKRHLEVGEPRLSNWAVSHPCP